MCKSALGGSYLPTSQAFNPTMLFKQALQNLVWLGGNAIYKQWFHLTCQGRENIPKNRPYLIAANHVSHLDGPAIISAQGLHFRDIYSLAAKDYFFNQPLKSWFCRETLNMIPTDRQGNSMECLTRCQEILQQNKRILIFPEGTRSTTGELQPLKLGLGFLAYTLNVPIIPTYVSGTYQALPKGKIFPKKHSLQVRFGEPLEMAFYQDKQETMSKRQVYQAIVYDVKKALEKLRDETLEVTDVYHSNGQYTYPC